MSYNEDKYCSEKCQEASSPIGICDSCRFYNFNGDKDGIYIGEGHCTYLNEPSEPYYGCEEFICMNVKQN